MFGYEISDCKRVDVLLGPLGVGTVCGTETGQVCPVGGFVGAFGGRNSGVRPDRRYSGVPVSG